MKNFIKILFYILLALLGMSLFVKTAAYGVNKQEEVECYKWQRWAKEYPLFYLTRWQADQCEAHNIAVDAPVLGGDKLKAPEVAETIQATVYSYSSAENQTDGNPSRMASNKYVYDGAIACPSRYPFGTQVEISGRVYTCEDRMAKKYRDGNNFDIWQVDYETAKEWGVQDLAVKILK